MMKLYLEKREENRPSIGAKFLVANDGQNQVETHNLVVSQLCSTAPQQNGIRCNFVHIGACLLVLQTAISAPQKKAHLHIASVPNCRHDPLFYHS